MEKSINKFRSLMLKNLASLLFLIPMAAFTYTCSSGGGGNDDPPPAQSSSSAGVSSGGGSSSSAALCGGAAYNSAAQFCASDGKSYDKCGGGEYDPAVSGCCDGVEYAKAGKFCFGGREIEDKCNGKEFDLASQRCASDVVETECDGAWYDFASLPDNRCHEDIYQTRCGTDSWYDEADVRHKCEGGVLKAKCGDGNNYHNVATQFCNGNDVVDKCGGNKDYDPANQRCENNVVETICGTGTVFHNPATEGCCANSKYATATQFCAANNTIQNKCGGTEFNPASQRCGAGNVVETSCGAAWYNAANANLRCQSNIVEQRCGTGSIFHNPATEQCCANSKYATATQFCAANNTVQNKCGGATYNTATEFCDVSTVRTKCGGATYASATQFCYNSSKVGNFCGSRTEVFDPDLYECRESSKIYLKTKLKDTRSGTQEYEAVLIGAQTWMAENLNYNADGSMCYDNSDANCATYGRLYDWATAMAGAASSTATPSGVQGVCPSGWHVPSIDEWTVLMQSVGGTGDYNLTGASTALKTTSGWKNNNGTDDYGFAAKDGGTYFYNTDNHFQNGGNGIGYWWSATESTGGALLITMSSNNGNANRTSQTKSDLKSIRCVKN